MDIRTFTNLRLLCREMALLSSKRGVMDSVIIESQIQDFPMEIRDVLKLWLERAIKGNFKMPSMQEIASLLNARRELRELGVKDDRIADYF